MKAETVREVQRDLRAIGWPIWPDGKLGPRTREAVGDFKRGYAFYSPMLRRGSTPGPATRRAIRRCRTAGGLCSPHFHFRDFASKGDGWIRTHRDLVRGLERLRRIVGPIGVRSGYRDPRHNASVGGKTQSQHLFGNAIDPIFRREVSVAEARRVGAFSGIGYNGGTGGVRHLDVRHVGPNTTGGSPRNPTTWIY